MELPLYSEEQCDAILRHLSHSMTSFVHQAGYKRVVLGLSGGMDSTLVLAIAIDALGVENVDALFMPSLYTTNESKQCIRELMNTFDVHLTVMPIDSLLSCYNKEYKNVLNQEIDGIALENLQARIRATILMTYSNLNATLVLATGNKSEFSVGFCTLYGDTCGAIAPIGDIYKTHVYLLAKRCEIIYAKAMPQMLFTKKPSAELAYKQCDEDRLPPYPILDAILYSIEHGYDMDIQNIATKEYVEQTKQLYKDAQFKKNLYPPVISIEGMV